MGSWALVIRPATQNWRSVTCAIIHKQASVPVLNTLLFVRHNWLQKACVHVIFSLQIMSHSEMPSCSNAIIMASHYNQFQIFSFESHLRTLKKRTYHFLTKFTTKMLVVIAQKLYRWPGDRQFAQGQTLRWKANDLVASTMHKVKEIFVRKCGTWNELFEEAGYMHTGTAYSICGKPWSANKCNLPQYNNFFIAISNPPPQCTASSVANKLSVSKSSFWNVQEQGMVRIHNRALSSEKISCRKQSALENFPLKYNHRSQALHAQERTNNCWIIP